MSWLWRSRGRHISGGCSGIRHRCGAGGPWQGSLLIQLKEKVANPGRMVGDPWCFGWIRSAAANFRRVAQSQNGDGNVPKKHERS
jgi:hypothetical protein